MLVYVKTFVNFIFFIGNNSIKTQRALRRNTPTSPRKLKVV